jgi:hypothetical protein
MPVKAVGYSLIVHAQEIGRSKSHCHFPCGYYAEHKADRMAQAKARRGPFEGGTVFVSELVPCPQVSRIPILG